MTNMYNRINTLSWEPLSFQDLTLAKSQKLTKKKITKHADKVEPKPEPKVIEVDNSVIEQQLAIIKQQAKEQAYQEGFNLGKEEGFNIGQQAGYEQGYAIGQQEGKAAIEQQLNAEKLKAVETITNLVSHFHAAINQIDDLIVPQLLDLALVAAQKTVGTISKVKQKQLMHTIKTLIDEGSMIIKSASLHLHPDDLLWIEPLLQDEIKQYHWQLVADTNVELGDCKIWTDTNQVDASNACHWQMMADCIQGENL